MIKTLISLNATGKGNQTARYLAIYEVQPGKGSADADRHLVRVSIQSDSYPEQSWAKIELFRNNEWTPLHHILPMAMKTKRGGYGMKEEAVYFTEDEEELLRVAGVLLKCA